MTVEEISKLMEQLAFVYPVVRLVDAEETTVWEFDGNGGLKPGACCYEVWGKSCRCENCSSLRACRERCTVDKYELFERDAYHVTSKYVEVDGKGYTLEIVSEFEDRDSLFIVAEREKSRDRKIMEMLASEYTGVYYVDLKTGEAVPYSIADHVENKVGDIFERGVRYTDAYRFCVENLVHVDDRKRMAEAGTLGNVMKELRDKKTFRTIYRDNRGLYCEMKFVKMGDAAGIPEAVALCFSEKDAELRAQEEDARRLRRNLDIIGILASEYTSVYYIDMDTDELDTYTMNEETENEFGKVFRAGISYSNAFQLYVNTLVHPEDREMMRRAGSTFNILGELSNRKTFVTRYRNAAGRNCEMKFVRVGDDEFPKAVALGFSDRV